MDIHIRFWDELLDKHFGHARQTLGQHEAAMAWTDGRGLNFDQAVEYALDLARD